MPIRNFALKTAALLALATMSSAVAAKPFQQPSTISYANNSGNAPVVHAASGIATNVVLIITTPTTISYGEDVGGYALVSASDGSTLTGMVTFFDGAANICTIPVTQTTSCPPDAGTGFAVGTHFLTAAYLGDATHLGSTSNAVPIIVVPDVTILSLTNSANPTIHGQPVAFTATARADHATPSGPVTFLDGSALLGTATLNGSGLATITTTSLEPGTHTITAVYAGDAKTAASSSAALVEVVNASSTTGHNPFTLAVAGSPTVDTGRAVNLLVTVAPQGGSIQPVQLSCAGLPSESTCTFGTATLPANGGTTSLQITTMAPHSCGLTVPLSQSAAVPFAGPAFAGLMLLFIPRRKRKMLKGLLVVLVAACGLATLTGCGNCTDLGTRPGDYTIKVIGTSTGTATDVVVTKIVLHVTVPGAA